MNRIFDFGIYLVGINIIGFIFYIFYKWARSRIIKNILSFFLYLLAIAGGSLGLVLAILIFDRTAAKDGLSLKVFAFASLGIELVLFLLGSKDISSLRLNFLEFFKDHPYLLAYILIINLASFFAFAYDKHKAKKNGWRIKNGLLLALSFTGGAVGGLFAMKLFRHKTQKTYYKLGLPLMVLMQVLVLVYIMNMR